MKEHGIAFSPAMLEAIRDGRKTQTRRIRPRKIEVGDRIWVKEKLQKSGGYEAQYALDGLIGEYHNVRTLSDGTEIPISAPMCWHWQRDTLPAMYMPKWAARTWLEVVAVWQEDLQDISQEDALAEGIKGTVRPIEYVAQHGDTALYIKPSLVLGYMQLWDSLHKKPGERWDDNPLVQVIEFKLIKEGKP